MVKKGPYLDVMTIHTRQLVQNPSKKSSTELLVEPMHMPTLTHTRVKYMENDSKYPLFYPDGSKNCNFRDSIEQSLRTSVSVGRLPDYLRMHSNPSWDSKKQRRDDTEKSSTIGIPMQRSPAKVLNPERLSNVVKKRNQMLSPSRKVDLQTKSLISELRHNSKKIENLV